MKHTVKHRMAVILTVCLAFTAAVYGQETKTAVSRQGDRLHVHFELDAADMGITANERMTITPVVMHEDDRVQLAPVLFTGRIRHKVDVRREQLYGTPAVPAGTYRNIVVRHPRKETPGSTVLYEGEIDYEPWMGGGRLVLYRDLSGCAGHEVSLSPLIAAEIAAPRQPRLSMVMPADEPLKQRSEQITAVVLFPQGRSVLLRDFSDNRRQLARIDSLTARLAGNDSLTVEAVYLKGYASPEDTYAYNTRLSANRVRAIRNYLQEHFGLEEQLFTTETEPEDWDSLRRWVAASDIPVRDKVLAVIDTTPDPDARDAGIWAIDNGKTYLKLLHEAYPGLRRVDYRVSYTPPAFTAEQARQLIRTHPEWLSLAEICRVAASCPVDSPERAYACAVALEYYPDDPCACNNMAMLALRRGDVQTARQCLSRCAEDPRVQNNLGILCLIDGDTERAQNCFAVAAKHGSAEGAYNLAYFNDLECNW